MTLLAAAICAAVVIVFVVLWAAVAMNGQTVGRPEDEALPPGQAKDVPA